MPRKVTPVSATRCGSTLLAFSVAIQPTVAQCVSPPSGLVSWWRAEGNALDSAGGNHGSLINGATFAPGKVGQAFSFDGIDDYVMVGNPASLDLTQDVTLEAWVRPAVPLVNSQLVGVITKWGINSFNAYGLFLNDLGGVIRVVGGVGVPGSPDGGIFGGVVPVGIFTHIAMTYQAATGANKLFVNGVEVASRVRLGGIAVSTYPFLIGRDSTPERFWGQIDEPSIYNRALEPSELLAIFNAGSAGKCAVCYANCDNSTLAPALNVNDFICFSNRYAAADPYANCDGSTVPPVLNVNDFTCFLNSYAAGCP